MKYFYLILFFFFISCSQIDCDSSALIAKERECLLIFEELPRFSSYKLDAKGYNLLTKQECTCSDEDRWWVQYRDFLEKGDTIIKRKGELIFSIHKKDTILSFDWECQGKIYK